MASRALPRVAIERLSSLQFMVSDHRLFRWALVSIYSDAQGASGPLLDAQTERRLLNVDMARSMSMRFSDVTDNPEVLARMRAEGKEYVLFDEDMASRLVKFIDSVHADGEGFVFVAHCDGGVSRSGAVALFAAERAGIQAGEFFSKNPNVQPNAFVLRLLHAAAGMTPMSAEEAARQAIPVPDGKIVF